jgi:prevent-host-death family protein
MPDMRVTSLELHQKLGQMIDKARFEPVVVTKHDREHVVIVSAERYAFLLQAARKARLTGSLSPEERALAVAATVPSDAEQERILTEMAAAVEANHGGQVEP